MNRKVAELACFTEQENVDETKETLKKNTLEKEELIKLKTELLTRKLELRRKMDQLEKFSESFSFFVNQKTSIHEHFIGKIKHVSELLLRV